jgi:hypothetical protein
MMFRRTKPKTPMAYCQSCARIRAFLAVAGLLIIALPLFGEKAAPFAQLTPMGIALALVGMGSIAFVARWVAWRQDEARKRQDGEDPTDATAHGAAPSTDPSGS